MPRTLLKKETLAQGFFSGFYEISKNNFFTEHVWAPEDECKRGLRID